jgi:N-methylhydantoinase A
MSTGWRVGIDIGGTFTDVIAINALSGEVRSAKVDTCLEDRVKGLLSALRAVDLPWSQVDDLIHGTTMVTNAIVENHLSEVALVATLGFSDTLEIGRQNRRYLYRLDLPPKVTPQVPASLRFEIDERVDHRGAVARRLEDAAIIALVDEVAASGVKSVAVSLLHSYANTEHEAILGARLREKIPYVALSNEVNPEAREYERMSTTVLSASVMPLAAGYLDRLEAQKPESSRLHMFHSAGGMASPAALRQLPLSLAMSGPAAGVAAARHAANQLKAPLVISFDMGGTTTDVCLIVDGEAQISSDRSLGERPIRLPMIGVDSIGAGGGSVARLDYGALLVGPESAGSTPGPVCYGRGGELPTVTDANLALGYLDAERPLGTVLRLNLSLAVAAIDKLASEMNMSLEEAALGIVRVANATMVRALRRTTVERGVDGRRCVLMAFGGAGPMHAVEVARAFGISKVIVPAHSGAFSALGCVDAEMSYSQQRTVRMGAWQWEPARLGQIRATLCAQLSAPLRDSGYAEGEISVQEVAAIRYVGQSYAIEVLAPNFADPALLGQRFFALHEQLYGFSTKEPWELVAVRMRVFAPCARAAYPPGPAPSREARPHGSTRCTFAAGAALRTPRYDRAQILVGSTIRGPAIVEDAWSTIVIPPHSSLNADAFGHLHIETEAGP